MWDKDDHKQTSEASPEQVWASHCQISLWHLRLKQRETQAASVGEWFIFLQKEANFRKKQSLKHRRLFLLQETNKAVYRTNPEPLAVQQTLGFHHQCEFKRSKHTEEAAILQNSWWFLMELLELELEFRLMWTLSAHVWLIQEGTEPSVFVQ